ncbi:helix-turn-helix domain-containing protein [Dactylosporangium sp. CA-139114]|uniref:helix-turn-helix domain-containing protein n=1 Tax=Dactylosporangium sp. CA-139114 TaxID=3239931 RepID=UPI003D975E2A
MRDRRELAGAWSSFQSHGFAPPAAELAELISHYWWARWDLRGQPDYIQLMVPRPNVQLTFSTTGPPMVRGVARGRVTRVLSGRAAVVGVAFRPGVFRRYLNAPVDTITDRALPAEAAFTGLPPLDLTSLTTQAEPAPPVDALNHYLLTTRPEPDPPGDEAAARVGEIAGSPDLRRVDQLTARWAVSERHLQRLFAEHVGVSPKWVLRRFRLHEVTERMAARTPIDWATLAADLGYADQAHLTRDFTNMFGEPPTSYAARY